MLWLNNETLIEQLRRSHAEVAEANLTLSGEIEHRKKVEYELLDAKELFHESVGDRPIGLA